METYFNVKLFMYLVIPVSLLLILGVAIIWVYISESRKDNLMESLGYKYNKGFDNAPYEFQNHWSKGNIRIHYREISGRPYKKILQYVEKQEKR